MPDYLSARQNAVTQDPVEKIELNSYLETVADEFGSDWLERSDGNPVQQLWELKHAQATNELLTLGQAIRNLLQADPAWTRRQVSEMKSGDVGQRAGKTFEILGSNLFNGPGQRIVPAPEGQAGYDGTVFLDDGSSLLVSIKNHGITSHETEFLGKAEGIYREFLECVRRSGANARKMFIEALRRPTSGDWLTLHRQVQDMFSGESPEESDAWQGRVEPLPAEWSPLSSRHLSYGFMLLAPFHQNEQKNFEENIRKGIANLEKHCPVVGQDVCRTLFLRLSATASMSHCAKWATDYFAQYPETTVELVILYQAVPAVDLTKQTTAITHFMIPVQGPNFHHWKGGGSSRNFTMHSFVGTIQSKPTKLVLHDGVRTIPIDGSYMFQKSEIFRYYDPSKGPVNAVVSNPASGVFVNAVIGDMALAMRAPETSRLLLLP